jgi:hypothetical protein
VPAELSVAASSVLFKTPRGPLGLSKVRNIIVFPFKLC